MGGTSDWPGGSEDLPDFGPPGPADDGRVEPSLPPPPPPSPPDQQPPPGMPPGHPAGARDGQSTGALVVGVLALIFSFFCALLGVPLAIVAIVLGVRGRRRNQAAGMPAGVATAGLVLGFVSLALAAVWLIVFFAMGAGSPSGG